MEVTTPDESLSDVIGGLNSRRASIEGIDPHEGFTVVRCLVPLAETFGYATNLRSMSQGRASFFMSFDHYEEIPRELADAIGTR